MKTLPILLLLTIVCFVSYSSAIPLGTQPLVMSRCCKSAHRTPILKGRIKHMERTHEKCTHKAIRVTTVCNMTICINSTWKWADNVMTEFEKAVSNKEAPSAPFNILPCNGRSN